MGDLLKMYSFNASSERRMRLSLTRVMPLTAMVVAGPPSETTSAAAAVVAGTLGSEAGVTGIEVEAAVVTGAASGAGAFTMGASFFAAVTGSGLLARMLLTGIAAEGFDRCVLAAAVSTLAGAAAGLAVTRWAVVCKTGSDFAGSGEGVCTAGA